MRWFKWGVVVDLHVSAAIAALTGHTTAAIALAIAAVVALLVALDRVDDVDEKNERGLSDDRLSLVVSYARLPQCPFDLLAQDDGAHWRLYLPCQRRAGHVGAHSHPSAAALAAPGMTSWLLTGPRCEVSA